MCGWKETCTGSYMLTTDAARIQMTRTALPSISLNQLASVFSSMERSELGLTCAATRIPFTEATLLILSRSRLDQSLPLTLYSPILGFRRMSASKPAT